MYITLHHIIEWLEGIIFGTVVCIQCAHCSFSIDPDEIETEDAVISHMDGHRCLSQPRESHFLIWSRRFFFFYFSTEIIKTKDPNEVHPG